MDALSTNVLADLAACSKAEGLDESQRGIVERLARVVSERLGRNKLRMDYYHDRVAVKNLGIAVPSSFNAKVDTSVGWAAKAVDMLASRSIFDGFTMAGATDADLDGIMAANDMRLTYDMAVPSELIHGCGFWTVSPGDADRGEPPVVINYHDAESSAALYDYRRKRILAGLVVEDWRPKRGGAFAGEMEPCVAVVHTDAAIITMTRGQGSDWTATAEPNALKRCLMEPMCYKPTVARPFGRSRVSRTVMGITDDMKREILRTSIHSEMFSSVQKAVLGVSEDQFDALNANKYDAAITSLFVATRDEDGNVPQLTQFQQASMEPHMAMMNKLASRMASETSLPVSAFGVEASTYQSAESLRASTADLVCEAESLNAVNGRALRNVALLAMAMAQGKRFSELTPEELTVAVHWRDPSMPSNAAETDAMVKQASMAAWLPETRIYWEKLGYSEEQRDRLFAEKGEAERATELRDRFAQALGAAIGGE